MSGGRLERQAPRSIGFDQQRQAVRFSQGKQRLHGGFIQTGKTLLAAGRAAKQQHTWGEVRGKIGCGGEENKMMVGLR